MNRDYRDLLYRERPQSPDRAPMPPRDRAAQFSPFAALSGYEELLQETARYTRSRPQLSEDEQALLDERLRQLAARGGEPEVFLRFFSPDLRKEGGSIRELRGHFLRLDSQARLLVLREGSIPADELLWLEGPEPFIEE